MKKNTLDKISLVFTILLGIVIFISTFSFAEETRGTTSVYIKVLGIAIIFLSTLNLIALHSKHNKKNENTKFRLTKNPKRFFSFFIILLVYITLIQMLSKLDLGGAVAFFIASAIFIPITSFVLGYKKPVVIASVTVGTLLFIWVVFVFLLGVPLP